MTDRPSDLDTVREALEHDSRQDRFYRASTEALDRIEAVVNAARAVKDGAPVTLLDDALASLDQETQT